MDMKKVEKESDQTRDQSDPQRLKVRLYSSQSEFLGTCHSLNRKWEQRAAEYIYTFRGVTVNDSPGVVIMDITCSGH